jgi:hypothetical protein
MFQPGGTVVSHAADVVPGSKSGHDKITPSPFVEVSPRQEAAPTRSAAEESLRRANFELRLQNAKLTDEVGAQKRFIEGQNQGLIALANGKTGSEGKVRELDRSLAVEKTMRSAAVARVVELQNELNGVRSSTAMLQIYALFALAFAVGLLAVVVRFASKASAAILARLPSETVKEQIDGMGEDIDGLRRKLADAKEKIVLLGGTV